jgi:hypothetical protein
MKWLLIITSFAGHVQMMHVTKEQCLAAVNHYQSDQAARLVADCFPPDAKYDVEGDSQDKPRDIGGKSDVHGSGFGRTDLPQLNK